MATFQQLVDKTTKEGKLYDPEIPGLYLRVGKRQKTWGYHRYGKRRALLDNYSQHTLEDARQWVRELEGLKRTAWTVEYVLASLEARARAKGHRKPDYVRKHIARYTPEWLGRSVSEITKPLVNAAHAKIPPVSGHFWVKAVGTMFNHAINQLDYEGRNPARGLDTTPPKARQRVLTDAELAAFLERARALDGHWWAFFYVLAHTGARKGNVMKMQWADVDLEKAVWIIPASQFKTKTAHTVYLTPAVVEVLRGRKCGTGAHI